MKFASILWLLLSPAVVVADTCACEAKKLGFTINCSNRNAMSAAVAALIANACSQDCKSSTCTKNFFIMQAHHDYCLDDELPESVEDAFHIYEDACAECDILKKVDPGLPNCPSPNCNNGSGDAAFNTLTTNKCVTDCSPNICKTNFRTLKAVHDLCDEDALSSSTELGYHDLEEACEDASCNVGDAATQAAQLVCPTSPPSSCPTGTVPVPGLGCICFSGASSVETPSGEMVALQDLALGDYVKTSGGIFEPVYGFAHYAPNAVANFLEIATTAHNSKLQVSDRHMIRAQDGSYMPAGSVQVGDVLYQGYTVTEISVVQAKGVFAPYTPSGTIVIDGIETSCYVVPDMDIAGVRFTGQWLAHTFEFPHRVACHYLHSVFGSDALCKAYNTEGISILKETPMKLYNQLMTVAPVWMQALVLSAVVLVLITFSMTEFLVFKQPLLLVVLTQGAFYMICTSKKQIK